MANYPIWNKINQCIYSDNQGKTTGNKSYGIKEHGENEILIGTSSKNSFKFLETKITCKKLESGKRSFHFYIDNRLIKSAVIDKENNIIIKEHYDWIMFLS